MIKQNKRKSEKQWWEHDYREETGSEERARLSQEERNAWEHW